MVFSSLIFLFRFMPIFFICYFLLPMKYKNFCLLIFSLLFYSWGEPKYIILMITSILVDYCISQRIWKEEKNKKRQKLLLSASIIFNIGMLFVFKYYNFITVNVNNIFKSNIPLSSMTLPLGISFYTFQTLSYTIDVVISISLNKIFQQLQWLLVRMKRRVLCISFEDLYTTRIPFC